MEPIAKRKLHVAPWARQERMIRRLIREGKHRNATDFVRRAIDHYLEHLGRPTLSEQVRSMAEDFQRTASDRTRDPSCLQEPSRDSDESW